ncbi:MULTISPECIES: TauD/TfdA family dioxygenase [Actinoalloteichus]|uniref:TauD/TfdA family dioxygenase n=1 Tax=Actinoalloteichus TaxID=65496 RepID=UPI0012FB16E5|nr:MULTISPECIES: TauD/TfdA family dioxygenase [Actinoalloteichus]
MTSRSVLFGGSAGHLGAIFEPTGPGLLGVRLRLDGLARWSPQAARWRDLLVATIRRHEHIIPLAAGQGYVLNNRRWLHGRRAFTGQRVMYRAVLEPQTPIPAGWPR